MKISIITVCYNAAATIQKTIASVRQQSYKNIEYIIVDGASQDGTLAIIDAHKDIVNITISEKDKGLYDAMNKGIKLASGDIVGILNADDTFHHNTVLEEVAAFHKAHDIEASVGTIIQHNAAGKLTRRYSANTWLPEKLTIGFMPPHPSIFFKRSLFEQLGYYHLDFTIGADYELITRFFLKNQISWQFSNITTTAMLIGGLSSSGFSSYTLITKEIEKALSRNDIGYSTIKIQHRWIWKLFGFLKK